MHSSFLHILLSRSVFLEQVNLLHNNLKERKYQRNEQEPFKAVVIELSKILVTGSYNVVPLIVFFVLYFMMSVVTTGLSVSAGMFIPALLSGAAWGRLVGIGMENCFPDSVSFSLLMCLLIVVIYSSVGWILNCGRKNRCLQLLKILN